MMGWLKNRVRKRDYDDLEDIRSSVVGQDFRNPEPDFPRAAARPPEAAAFDPIERHFGEFEPRFEQPPGFSTVDTRYPEQSPVSERSSRDYDILDRLNLIESQLSAIRSQTETINERLKNMEAKLTRRY